MKVFVHLLLLFGSLTLCSRAMSQERAEFKKSTTGKDSLVLTHSQTLKVYSFNIQVGQEARSLHEKYKNVDSLLRNAAKLHINSDSLFQRLLPSDQYQMYKQKKVLLISSELKPIEVKE